MFTSYDNKTVNKDRIEENIFPLSYPQLQLWFITQVDPETPVYNDAFLIRMPEKVNIAALEESFTQLIQRHEILRTIFKIHNSAPVQAIQEPFLFRVDVTDLRELKSDEREAEFTRITMEFNRRPFDLSKLPLFRAMLILMGNNDYRLFCVLHHMIIDGYSVYQVLLPELEKIYTSLTLTNTAPNLGRQSIQYADFAKWQREYITEQQLSDSIDYWKSKLENLSVMDLPADYSAPKASDFKGKRKCFTIDKETLGQLKELSRSESITLHMLLVAAVKTLLFRYSGQVDMVVGTMTAGRVQPELETMIGNFVNPVILRSRLRDGIHFNELLKQIQTTAAEAYSHQLVPFCQLVSTLSPERRQNQSPLFQVPVVMQPHSSESNLNWTSNFFDIHADIAKFELSFTFDELGEDLIGAVEYRTSLFKSETIKLMIGHFTTLIGSILENPRQKIATIPILTQKERNTIQEEWKGSKVPYRNDVCLHQLFEEQVQTNGNRIAVVLGNDSLTYRELDNKANQLARLLKSVGAGPDMLIGIYLERSIELVVSMLAVLKIGAAYVPIDSEYPKDRITFMVEDSKATVVLTQSKLLEGISGMAQTTPICVDTDERLSGFDSTCYTNDAVSPDSNAYVIYTSGTTGKPKGVVISHKSICNHMLWMLDTFQFVEQDSVLQKTPYSFDASVWEFYAPLLVGGKLVLADPGAHKDSSEIICLLKKHKITILQGVPSLLLAVAENDELKQCTDLRMIFSGGEALPRELERKILSNYDVELYNLYGPTEACIDSVFWQCKLEDSYETVPIGRPISNCEVYILDSNLQPVPVGKIGELYLGGIPLAKEYLGRPELTKKKFIVNPFENDGSKLYKTGDLVKWMADGNIQYTGRIDDQVKLRGYRIELREVEATLAKHKFVKQAAVVVNTYENGKKELGAYVVPENKNLVSKDLRDFLEAQLPSYMVPSYVTVLAAMPLTTNGKVDHKALLALKKRSAAKKQSYVSPRNETEELLVEIWSKVLKVSQVGIHDNFFEIGGDSILSMMVQSAANQKGLRLTAKQLLDNQTIAEVSSQISTPTKIDSTQGMVKGEAPLTSSQYYVFDITKPNPDHFAMSTWLKIPVGISTDQISSILNKMALHHDNLRLRFTSTGENWDEWKQEYGDEKAAVIPVEEIDFSNCSSDEIEKMQEVLIPEQSARINITNGPIARATLCRYPDSTHRLLLTIHYIVADAMSWRILQEDFEKSCNQVIRGEDIQFPPKTSSYAKWSRNLSKYVDGLNIDPTSWYEENWDEAPPIPVDFPNGREQNGFQTIAEEIAYLNEGDTQKLIKMAPKILDCNITDILLAAFSNAFCTSNKSKAVIIDVETHGREVYYDDIDLSRTVGIYTVVFPVLFRLGENTLETLRKTKEKLRSKTGIDFSLLRFISKDRKVRKRLEKLHRADISFNYMGQYEKNTVGFSRLKSHHRKHLIEINGSVSENKLQMGLMYSGGSYKQTTMKQLAETFMDELRVIVRHAESL